MSLFFVVPMGRVSDGGGWLREKRVTVSERWSTSLQYGVSQLRRSRVDRLIDVQLHFIANEVHSRSFHPLVLCDGAENAARIYDHSVQNVTSGHSKRRSFVWSKMRFDNLNSLDVDHECDGRTHGQTDAQKEPRFAIEWSNEYRHVLEIEQKNKTEMYREQKMKKSIR